jgi:dCMP deaminase
VNRPSRLDMLMEIAYVVSERSTCNRLHVGAVLAKDGRILSIGYNGPVSGAPHCNHPEGDYETVPMSGACVSAVHAEANAIAFAAKEGICVGGSTLFVTHQPCLKCAQLIINSGIVMVTYDKPYRLVEGVDLLRDNNVRILPYSKRLDS